MISDPYKVLGVSPDASDEEIQKAYRRLVKKYHPDVNPGDESAERKMREINAAYDQSGISEKEKLPEVSPTAEETRATEISADMAGATAVFSWRIFSAAGSAATAEVRASRKPPRKCRRQEII